jgi:hypothetical protein
MRLYRHVQKSKGTAVEQVEVFKKKEKKTALVSLCVKVRPPLHKKMFGTMLLLQSFFVVA